MDQRQGVTIEMDSRLFAECDYGQAASGKIFGTCQSYANVVVGNDGAGSAELRIGPGVIAMEVRVEDQLGTIAAQFIERCENASG